MKRDYWAPVVRGSIRLALKPMTRADMEGNPLLEAAAWSHVETFVEIAKLFDRCKIGTDHLVFKRD